MRERGADRQTDREREKERDREREREEEEEEVVEEELDPLHLIFSHAQRTGVCDLPEVGRFVSCVAFRTHYCYYRRMYSIKHRTLSVQ